MISNRNRFSGMPLRKKSSFLNPNTQRYFISNRLIPSFDMFVFAIFFILLLASYASLGKNILTNGSDSGQGAGQGSDPISTNIGYVRILVSFAMFTYIVVRHSVQDLFSAAPWILFPFILWAVISCSWSDDEWSTFRSSFFLLLIFFALPTIMLHLGVVRVIALLLHLIAVVVILSALLAILFPAIGTHTDTTFWAAHAGRWRGMFGHKNGLGPWAAYGSILLFSYSWLAGGARIYWWLARICAVLCLFFTGSATAVVTAIFMIIIIRAFRLRVRFSDGLIGVAAIVGFIIFAGGYYVFKEIIFEYLGRDDSFTGRTEVWSLALQSIADNPLQGSGYLTTGGVQFQAAVFSLLQQEIPGAENSYLTTMLELGVPGLVLFFVPLLYCIPRGLSLWNRISQEERGAIEVVIIITFAALLMGVTESTPFICTGYDGIVTFPAVFILASLNSYFPNRRF